MSFLSWDVLQEGQDSLDAINSEYGCPYILTSGYGMDQWAFITQSDDTSEWGFSSPRYRPGTSVDDLMNLLTGNYTEHDGKPPDWTTPVNI